MRYRPFGRTGLKVSVVGFGCWPMAGDRYGAIEDGEAVKAIHRALDRGVNCVDTAPAYGAGHSEEVVARALEGHRKDVVLVTKCGVKAPPPGQPGPLRDASRANILAEIDASLKRLRTDWVDVLLVHWPDAEDPVRGEHARAGGGRGLRPRALRRRVQLHRRHAGRVHGHPARGRLAGGLPHARPAPGAGDVPVLRRQRHRGDGLRLARPRPAHRGLHRDDDVRPRARLARRRRGLRSADLPRGQPQDERRGGGAAAPRGGRAARGAAEPDRAGLGAGESRDQHRAGGGPHAGRGGRQRRGGRAGAVRGRAGDDRRDPRRRGGPRAGVHPAAARHGAVGRGAGAGQTV